jgi:hypothetical protein
MNLLAQPSELLQTEARKIIDNSTGQCFPSFSYVDVVPPTQSTDDRNVDSKEGDAHCFFDAMDENGRDARQFEQVVSSSSNTKRR